MEYEFNQDLYIDRCSLFFDFLFRKRQWSGIGSSDYTRWLNNFNQIENGKYIAMRILDSLLYYSENDLLKMLDDTIMSIFEKDVVLPLQISRNFSCLPSEIEYTVIDAISKSIVMPSIEDFMDPGASGPEVIRTVRNHFRPQIQTTFCDKLSPSANYDRIIIVDDCIGSGDQCETFWTSAQIQGGKLLREWANETGVKVYYLALVGYKNAVLWLQKEYSDISIVCAEYVDDTHQIFTETSTCWKDKEEREWAAEELKKHARENGISLLGYSDLGFAVALHKTIPDWSLPVLYKNKNSWNHLIERKNTYD